MVPKHLRFLSVVVEIKIGQDVATLHNRLLPPMVPKHLRFLSVVVEIKIGQDVATLRNHLRSLVVVVYGPIH